MEKASKGKERGSIMHWWCTKCEKWVIAGLTIDPHTCIQNHKEKIVGIRPDILDDYVKRMVWALRKENRLEKMP